MTKNELVMLQSLPLEVKVAKTLLRIREFVEFYGEENVYICFSGGKDSTVLLHLVRSIYPDIEAVFSHTGLEFPELVAFANSFENVRVVRPERTFRQVIKEEGYPVVSKKVSMMIKRINSPDDQNVHCRKLFLEGIKMDGTKGSRGSMLPYKWRYLLDAPYKISDECCKILKKDPLKNFQKESGKIPIMGTMAVESDNRTVAYLKNGCNTFKGTDSKSTPIGFWTEQDVLKYIYINNIRIASVYGDVVINENGKYETTGEKRTGCIFCALGCTHEGNKNNRFQRLERTHPELHRYCMNDLGMAKVLDHIGVKYTND